MTTFILQQGNRERKTHLQKNLFSDTLKGHERPGRAGRGQVKCGRFQASKGWFESGGPTPIHVWQDEIFSRARQGQSSMLRPGAAAPPRGPEGGSYPANCPHGRGYHLWTTLGIFLHGLSEQLPVLAARDRRRLCARPGDMPSGVDIHSETALF
ncbi:unnamed protein product [Diplocarpon coronariae]|nr:hypothetical protein JHW43_004915 [Diplocarpon mali]